MSDPQQDIRQGVGDIFNADPAVAVLNTTASIGKKAQEWMSLATKAAQEAGLDPEFVTRLIGAESNWNPSAVSKKGAQGLMQVLPSTAKQYGVSNLMNPAENIKAGISYLKDLTKKYGQDRPDLVAAAYNAGPGAVDKSGGVPSYPETQVYVQKVAGPDLEKLWKPVDEGTSSWTPVVEKTTEPPQTVAQQKQAGDKGVVLFKNTPTATPSTNVGLAAGTASQTLPIVQNLLERFGTNPNLQKVGSSIGRVVGGISPIVGGAYEAGPLGAIAGLAAASKGAWAGGKTGWFTAKLAQDVARPLSRLVGAAAPYASLAFKASALQTALDLAQQAEPNRKDIGMLGVAIGDRQDPNHPALINALWNHLMSIAGSEKK